ncbi:MAG: pof2 [Chlamydiales bacterium]|nr:pof2 [Chlamydiales bacterium]
MSPTNPNCEALICYGRVNLSNEERKGKRQKSLSFIERYFALLTEETSSPDNKRLKLSSYQVKGVSPSLQSEGAAPDAEIEERTCNANPQKIPSWPLSFPKEMVFQILRYLKGEELLSFSNIVENNPYLQPLKEAIKENYYMRVQQGLWNPFGMLYPRQLLDFIPSAKLPPALFKNAEALLEFAESKDHAPFIRQIRHISLYHHSMTAPHLKQILLCFPHLKTLDLSQLQKLSGEDLIEVLQNRPGLTSLSLNFCHSISGEDLIRALPPGIKKLDLRNCWQLTDEHLIQLLNTVSLCSLKIAGCTKLTGRGLAQALASQRDLATLDISNCPGIDGPSLVTALQTNKPFFKKLSCYSCPEIAVSHLKEALIDHSLSYLNMSSCKIDSLEDFQTLLSSQRDLSYLNLSGCHPSKESYIQDALAHHTGLIEMHVNHCQISQSTLEAIFGRNPLLRKVILPVSLKDAEKKDLELSYPGLDFVGNYSLSTYPSSLYQHDASFD